MKSVDPRSLLPERPLQLDRSLQGKPSSKKQLLLLGNDADSFQKRIATWRAGRKIILQQKSVYGEVSDTFALDASDLKKQVWFSTPVDGYKIARGQVFLFCSLKSVPMKTFFFPYSIAELKTGVGWGWVGVGGPKGSEGSESLDKKMK